jgi:hypothetical protein
MDFWAGALGFFLGLAANITWERCKLYGANRAARKLAGEWVAYNYQRDNDRSIDLQTMPGAGLTVISAKSWWRAHSHVLDVRAQDLDSGRIRNHHGWIAIDPGRPQRATRTIFYDDSDEIEEQRILISDDGNTLHVFDESVGGGYSKKHALQRRMSPVSVILNSMTPEPVGVVSAPLETKQEDAILCARRGYALAFFVVSCIWLVVVTVLLFLSAFSVAHVSDSVLIAAITTIPALFVIFRFVLPGAPSHPHFANFERDPTTGKYRMLV